MSTLKALWEAEEKERYRDVFMLFSPGLLKRLNAYYPQVRIKTPADYITWRNSGAYEPRIQDISLMGTVAVKGPRATARANATVNYGGQAQEWEYDYVLIRTQGNAWRIDGFAAGPDGAVRASQSADLDQDGAAETVAFTGDPMHRTLRWEVVAPDGAQKYVFEMQACEAAPGASEDKDPFRRVTAQPIAVAAFGEGERAAFADQFPMWAEATDLNTALHSRRPGFVMRDGCVDNPSYFVFYFKDGYREIVQ